MRTEYKINRGGSLAHWLSSGMERKSVVSPEEAFSAPVNMGEAYVQIIYPVRRHFMENHHIEDVRRWDGEYSSITFPFEDSKVNFSTAINTPHHIWTYLKSEIEVPEDGIYPFSLATCGGVRLWVDGNDAFTFTPYDRDIPHTEDFSLSLTKGTHTFEVYMDELAERDVFFYIDFIYRGEKTIKQILDIAESPSEVINAEKFLMSVSLTRTVYKSGNIEAEFDSSFLEEAAELIISGVQETDLSFMVQKGMERITISPIGSIRAGKAGFTLRIGSISITRFINLIVAPEEDIMLPALSDINERKAAAIDFIASCGADNAKVASHGSGLIHQAMTIMKKEGKITERAERYIERSLSMIERKEDCADFLIVPLLWSMIENKELYPESLYEKAKRIVLGFRYWIDEKGNDVMWYFSENHAFLFHVSQYLAGYLFSDEIFSVSGRTGKEQMAIGRERVLEWFRNFNKYHYAEWNSATYFPIDLIGLFSLYEAAPDENIVKAASDALDYTFRIIHDNTFHGVMSSSFGRAYENTVKAKETNEPSFLSYIAEGKGWATESNRASALFSLSSYVPPEWKEEDLTDKSLVITICEQGLSPVWTYKASSRFHSIASTEAFKPFRHGHQQHIMDAVIGDNAAPFFINHPGEKAYSGENRPAYWAGNGTVPLSIQYRSLVMMIFDTDEKEAVDYIHAYFPTWEYDEYSIEGNYVFMRSGNGYLGAYFSTAPRLTDWGMNRNRELIAEGRKHLAVVRASDIGEISSYEEFKRLFKAMEIQYDKSSDSAFVTDFSYGTLSIGRDRTPMLNGKAYDWTEYGEYRKTVFER